MPERILIPLPLPLRTANVWLFKGSQPAIVDCGIGSPEGYAALLDGLRRDGVDPAKLRLFVSHGHFDHAGNAARLRRDFGVPLAAPRIEAPFVESFHRDAPRRKDAFAKALAAHGMPPDAVATVRREGDALDPYMEDVPIAHDLNDGERLVLGDVEATAHIAPGHTPGSTVFMTDDNELLSGDTLLQHITSNAIEVLDRDRGRYHQYLASLDGLRRFADCRVLPGHHDAFTMTETLIDDHLAKHHSRSLRILERLDRPKTTWQLLPEVLPHLAHDQKFLGMCEVVGHLHNLEIDGKVKEIRRDDDGVRRFERISSS